MRAFNLDDLWRCMCGGTNDPEAMHCKDCRKRRWFQLGLTRRAVERLIGRLRKVA